MKKILSKIIMSLFIVTLLPIMGLAEGTDYSIGGSAELSNKPYVFDGAGVLEQKTKDDLNKISKEIKEKYDADMVFATVDNLGEKTATQYADDYLHYNGYGSGNDKSATLFMISVKDRKWAISTKGRSIDVFTDAGQKYIINNIKSSLKKDDFNQAFAKFGSYSIDFYRQAKEGKPYDKGNMPRDSKFYLIRVSIAVLASAAISIIVSFVLKNQLKSVAFKGEANDYIKEDTMKGDTVEEEFLRSNTVSTYIGDSNSGSGGSSTHSSSGGTSGGSSGSF